MDDAVKSQVHALGEEADGLLDEVEAAFEEHAQFSQKLATRIKVDDLSRRWRELVGTLDEQDRMAAERSAGRKVIDLQKAATRLPAPPAGTAVEKKPQREFFETRSGDSSRQPRVLGATAGTPRRGEAAPKYRVTGEVESWCGPCAEMRTHTIIAMVGDQPAQVICGSCGGRHKYRPGPPDRKKTDRPATGGSGTHRPSAAEAEAARRSAEKRALQAELQAAEKVRPFDPKERYKAGEIIEHPEHGRGKIENTLPRSLLVRFPSGLRPIKLG